MNRRNRWAKGTYMRVRPHVYEPDTEGRNVFQRAMKTWGLSYRDVGTLAGCSHAFVWQLFTGRRKACTADQAERIALALRVSDVEHLFEPRMCIASSQITQPRKPRSTTPRKVTAA